MSQDWEWEDLLTDKEQAERKKKPKKRTEDGRGGSAAVRREKPDAGMKSRRQSNLVGENGQPKPKPKPKKAVAPSADDGNATADTQAVKKRKKKKAKKSRFNNSVFGGLIIISLILTAQPKKARFSEVMCPTAQQCPFFIRLRLQWVHIKAQPKAESPLTKPGRKTTDL